MPDATIISIGPILGSIDNKNAPIKSIQLYVSIKLCGVIRMMAAAAIIPIVTGLRSERTVENCLLFLNFLYRTQIHRTIIKEGRTTANVAVKEPKMHINGLSPIS